MALHDDDVERIGSDLTDVLDRIGDALSRMDTDDLAAVEPTMAGLAARLGELTSLNREQRRLMAPSLERAREALRRCERLGASLAVLADETYRVAAPAYGPRGLAPSPRVAPRQMGVKG